MPNTQFPTAEGWGHDAGEITPEDIVTGYRAHYAVGIDFGETFNRFGRQRV